MKYFLNYIGYLAVSIVLFFAAVFVYHNFLNKAAETDQPQLVKQVTDNIHSQLDEAQHHATAIEHSIHDNSRISFATFLIPSPTPYFVFKDKNLVFWSDNIFVPDYNWISSEQTYSFVNHKTGKYVVYHKSCKKDKSNYDIYVLVPLYINFSIENDYLHSGLNSSIFHTNTTDVIFTLGSEQNAVKANDGTYLFSFSIGDSSGVRNVVILNLVFVLVLGFAVALTLYVVKWMRFFFARHYYEVGVILLLLLLLVFRFLLLELDFPYSIAEFDLFNSKFFASSLISPSLGDYLINALAVIVFAFTLLTYYPRFYSYKWLYQSSRKIKLIVSVLLVLCSHALLSIVYSIFRTVNLHSQWFWDITMSIDFNYFRITSLFVFLIISIAFFALNHILIRIYLSLNKHNAKSYFLIGIIVSALTPLICWQNYTQYWVLVAVNTVFILAQYQFHMPRFLSKLRYSSYMYFISVALICAFAGALAIYRIYLEKIVIDKNKFASRIMVESDVLAEYLLNEVSQKINNDLYIKNILSSSFSTKESVTQKVKKIFLSNYFEKFDVSVAVYDQYGEAYREDEDFKQYNLAVKLLAKKKYSTEYKNIFFLNNPNNRSLPRYAVFSKVQYQGGAVGYILIQLKNKRIVPNSVFPELLLDEKYRSLNQSKSYSYAIFSKGDLESNFGTVNYEKDFQKSFLKDDHLFDNGIEVGRYHHLGFRNSSNEIIVVSSDKYSLLYMFSNFSFLFVLFLLIISLYLLIIAVLSRYRDTQMTYSTKIQIYLNIAFFLPLFVVALTTLSVIGSLYQDNLNQSFFKKAESMSSRLAIFFDDYKKGVLRVEDIHQFVQQLSKYSETDLSFYNSNGILISSNQPLIFQNNLLSKYINPEAMVELKERKNNTSMLAEHVGTLHYNSVYASVKAFDTGKLLGVVSIPFFESRQEVEKQIIEVLTTIINIFSSIFILFLILSYVASRALTVPLRIITHSIKRTSFGETNEPIQWTGKDEIGLLVGEYNTMLTKLEYSKEALKKSEKESAWREMAQQVAHEIKNPLTPMKLTIQHLKRGIDEHVPDIESRVNRGLQTLLTQVDNLSEIATSFSMFAKMPIPKNETFEVFPVLLSTARLYNNTSRNISEINIPEGRFWVNGDPLLMTGIFSNIILNAIQSMPVDRQPAIHVIGTVMSDRLMIEIKDNGCGIPEDIRPKVFLPNFSTKYAGSGIGLAVAKRGVEHAGGRIWFETVLNEGTSFFIELPLIV